MKELEPIRPRTNQPINHFGEQVTPEEILISRIGNPHERGWWFPAGDPEFWKFSDRLVFPGGQVLDLGLGWGRTSLFFALHGMRVTGYEVDQNALKFMTSLIEGYGLPIDVKTKDIRKADLGRDRYDTTLMAQTFNHFSSKREAFAVIVKAIEATKPNGYVWIRAGGKEDSAFEELLWYANDYPEVTKVDDDVYMAPCSCSGERKIESQLFFDPMELLHFLAKNGLRIIHTQVIPEIGRKNIMFGEDWEKGQIVDIGGMITIIAQK